MGEKDISKLGMSELSDYQDGIRANQAFTRRQLLLNVMMLITAATSVGVASALLFVADILSLNVVSGGLALLAAVIIVTAAIHITRPYRQQLKALKVEYKLCQTVRRHFIESST